jgi:O-antigen/teichoic acid export membrane protein
MSNVPEETFLEEPPLAGWRTLIRSFGTLAVGEIIARVVGLVALVVIARELEPYGFGLIVLGATLVNWFATVADSGTELIAMRNVSRQPGRFRAISGEVLGLRIGLSLVAMVLFAAAVLAVTGGDDRGTVLLLFALVLPALALNLRWIVLGVERARSVAFGNVSSQVLFAVGVLLLVTNNDSVKEVPLLRTGAELAYALIVFGAVARRFGIPVPRVDFAAWRSMLGQSLPVMGNNIARTLIYSADLFLIAAFLGSKQVGYYGAAIKPVMFLAGLVGLFAVAYLSSYSSARSRARRHQLGAHATSLGLLLSLPIAVLITVLSPFLIPLVYGETYAPAIAAFAILGWTIPIQAITTPYSHALIAADRQTTVMRHNIAAAAFNVGANLIAIPLFGISAAAGVTVASFALVLFTNRRSAVQLDLVPSIGAALRHGARSLAVPRLRSAPNPER